MVTKEQCTGCGACVSACPHNAISMQYDEDGFLIPVVERALCVECGACKQSCPILDKKEYGIGQVAFNVAAVEEEQKESASGGVFWLLAKQYIERGQYVAGAVWNRDWRVEHIVSNQLEDIKRMRSSKYVQSEIGDTFCKIKQLLNDGKQVLFSGTPCQVAGLKKYLGMDYNNLLTLSVICRGVASPELLLSHLNKINKNNKKIAEINFRKKDVFGSGIGMYIKYTDGSEYKADVSQDSFWFEYAYNLNFRKACYTCKFRDNFAADIIIGDADHVLRNSYVDAPIGISVVIPCTNEGMNILMELFVSDEIGWIGNTQMELVISRNIPLVKNHYINGIVIRNKLFDTWKNNKQKHYDVMLVITWALNYGTILTNFALAQTIKQMGYSVVMLNHYGKGVPPYTGVELPNQFIKFIIEHFDNSVTSLENISDTNELADIFIVGSDMIWDYELFLSKKNTLETYMLGWVDDDKRKISYATSFGTRGGLVPPDLQEKVSGLLGRMDAISVRESWGEELCKDLNVNAKHVLDPVWFLKKETYVNLIDYQRRNQDSVIFAYIMYPDKKKMDLIHECEKRSGLKAVISLDAGRTDQGEYEKELWEKEDIITPVLSIEEWLGYMNCAEYVITDSYHGTCFSVIFNKKFIGLPTRWVDRYETILECPFLSKHVADVKKDTDELVEILEEEIDYAQVDLWLEEKKKVSYGWLCKALGEK